MKQFKNDDAKRTALDGLMLAIGLAAVAFLSSGCGGMELGGRLGVYRVDERQESQRTYRQAMPLKCWFTQCGAPAADDVQGS